MRAVHRAEYRNKWADAYRRLVSADRRAGTPFELVRLASAHSWDSGERLSDGDIEGRVRQIIEQAAPVGWVPEPEVDPGPHTESSGQ